VRLDLVPRYRELDLVGFNDAELWMIAQTMEELRPDLICEWGTNVGYSARILWEARGMLGLTCPVHSIDISANPPILRSADSGKMQGHHVQGTGVQLHQGNGPVQAVNLAALHGALRPLLFIDDHHDFEHVSMELTLIYESIPRGTMLLHDAMLTRDNETDQALRVFLGRHGDLYKAAEVECMVRLWRNGIAAW
jgi:cephalosporin hydroxylase